MIKQLTHENFSRDQTPKRGPERSFGRIMAAGFAVVSLLNWWRGGYAWPWLAVLAVMFIVSAYLCPAALRPLNGLWFKLGLLLHAVMNPIVMGLLFYLVVLPTGLIMRVLGKDMLSLRREPDRPSYWITRRPPGPAPDTLKDQF